MSRGCPSPREPLVLNKFPSCVAAPTTADLPLPIPRSSWTGREVELVIVGGKEGQQGECHLEYLFTGFTMAPTSLLETGSSRETEASGSRKAMEAFAPRPGHRDQGRDRGPKQSEPLLQGQRGGKAGLQHLKFVSNVSDVISWVSIFLHPLPRRHHPDRTPSRVGAS